MTKVAVVVLAEMESHQDMGRVSNALQLAKESKQEGDDVEIIFDGGGTVTAVQLADPQHPLHKLYQQVEDKNAGLCSFCARAFKVSEDAEDLGLPLLDEFQQHPSLRQRIVDGYQVITF
jgi:hypothetical protein